MSQILSLIIGAAILMMVSMILMFSATDVIGGGVADAEIDSCVSQIESQCQVRASIGMPGSCTGLSANQVSNQLGNENLIDDTGDIEHGSTSIDPNWEVACEGQNEL